MVLPHLMLTSAPMVLQTSSHFPDKKMDAKYLGKGWRGRSSYSDLSAQCGGISDNTEPGHHPL